MEVKIDLKKKLVNLGYSKDGQDVWQKNGRVVHVHSSSFFGSYLRVVWKEKWKDDYAIIYDYSKAKGPICIVPITDLFNTEFVQEKRKQPIYADSGYWWNQTLSINHPLAQFILEYKNRWNLL